MKYNNYLDYLKVALIHSSATMWQQNGVSKYLNDLTSILSQPEMMGTTLRADHLVRFKLGPCLRSNHNTRQREVTAIEPAFIKELLEEGDYRSPKLTDSGSSLPHKKCKKKDIFFRDVISGPVVNPYLSFSTPGTYELPCSQTQLRHYL